MKADGGRERERCTFPCLRVERAKCGQYCNDHYCGLHRSLHPYTNAPFLSVVCRANTEFMLIFAALHAKYDDPLHVFVHIFNFNYSYTFHNKVRHFPRNSSPKLRTEQRRKSERSYIYMYIYRVNSITLHFRFSE